MGDDWGFLTPAGMEILWEKQIPNSGSINFAGGGGPWSAFVPANTRIWERTTCPPADFMLNKHIHEIRFPESYEENYESLH